MHTAKTKPDCAICGGKGTVTVCSAKTHEVRQAKCPGCCGSGEKSLRTKGLIA